jgi:hypothetical protein
MLSVCVPPLTELVFFICSVSDTVFEMPFLSKPPVDHSLINTDLDKLQLQRVTVRTKVLYDEGWTYYYMRHLMQCSATFFTYGTPNFNNCS